LAPSTDILFHTIDKPFAEVGPDDLESCFPRPAGAGIAADKLALRPPDRHRRTQHLADIATHVRVVPPVLEHDVMMAADCVPPGDPQVQLEVGGGPG
jgi:hypothetical protein